MRILVFNCGSSSLNYKLFNSDDGLLEVISHGKAHRVGVTGNEPAFIEHHMHEQYVRTMLPIPDHRMAARLVFEFLRDQSIDFDLIGHRFVHGGDRFQKTVWLTKENMPDIQACLPLASIHNPNSMSVIEACQEEFPTRPQYLTFDTAFHASLLEESYRYLLPPDVLKEKGYRKFGFHGLSYQYVSQKAAEFLGRDLRDLRIIACHLGTGGSSAAAIQLGRSVDTSMGYTPLAGLMMSTRTGDLDPILIPRLLDDLSISPDELDSVMNKKSGLLGISGFSSDIRDILSAMDEKADERARLAFEMYTTRLRKTIGSMAVEMGGVDLLVFTDDIGAQNHRVREAACKGMSWCGIALDETRNNHARPGQVNRIQSSESRVEILCMPTDEEMVIAGEGVLLSMAG